MCGFAGFVQFPGLARPAGERLSILERMGRQLARRGPDDQQIYDDGRLCFVFRRLSIIDVEGGRQPMRNESDSLVAAVNGEIYNHGDLRGRLRTAHQFRSRSDSEIVVHLFEDHGPGMLRFLNGMFALLVWDRDAGRLLLARDRLGIKPLYYTPLPGGLLFGSELKALLAHPDCPSDFCWHHVDLSYLDGDEYTRADYARIPTFVEGVSALPGGCSLEIDGCGCGAPARYWSLTDAIDRSRGATARPAAEYIEECAALFEDSVRLQLMSDVPTGLFLSGGVDSSAIAAVAARLNPELHCFSIHERTTEQTGDLVRARDLACALGLPFSPVRFDHETFAEQIGFGLESFEYLIWMMDAPRFAPESFFKHELHRYAKTRVPALKVILVGQGDDEFAGGYSRSLDSPRQSWAEYVERGLGPFHHYLSLIERGVPPLMRPFLRPAAVAPPDGMAPFHREMLARIHALQSHNLWNEDRVSSSQGVEARVPFLDHRLVEFLAAIPESLHPELFWNKTIIRQAVSRWLPGTHFDAPKVGFWLAQDTSSVHHLMRQCLQSAWPNFREKYQTSSDAVFRTSTLDEYCANAASSKDALRSVKILLACMAITVFVRFCRRLRFDDAPVRLMQPPSPLRES